MSRDSRGSDANYGRLVAYDSFVATLESLHGLKEVSEGLFRDEWLARLNKDDRLTVNGWYDPPENGMAVLFADEADTTRVSFESLRLPAFGPTAICANWASAMMYAYCSPIDRETGLAGDFGVTLYFGRNEAIRSHFRACYRVVDDLLAAISPNMSSGQLFALSENMFRDAGLRNTIASVSDAAPLDLGHSMPTMEAASRVSTRELDRATKESLRSSRRFVGTTSEWPLCDAGQFTIEPQLIDPFNLTLPQVSFHYVVSTARDQVVTLRECDALLARLELT